MRKMHHVPAGEALDLSLASTRPVSPVHVEDLHNMAPVLIEA